MIDLLEGYRRTTTSQERELSQCATLQPRFQVSRAKLAEIRKKDDFKYYVRTFFPIHELLREINIRAG